MTERRVTLGGQGFQCSKIGFGCMGTTAALGKQLDVKESVALLQICHREGSRHFDTAEISLASNPFSRRLPDRVVGNFLESVDRKSISVAVKYDLKENGVGLAEVRACVEESLANLRVEFVDLYYGYRMSSVEEVTGFMESAKVLVSEGKIKYLGLCDTTAPLDPAWIRAAHAIHPLTCVQQEWSLCERRVDAQVVPVCAELNIGIVAFSPLARRLLLSTQTQNFAENKRIADVIRAIAVEKTPPKQAQLQLPQIALAWVYKHAQNLGVTVVGIPGTSKPTHVLANIQALDINLTEADMKRINDAIVGPSR
jgi:aryl-alcohol dehydrogenase-like predicted oxidoreductase